LKEKKVSKSCSKEKSPPGARKKKTLGFPEKKKLVEHTKRDRKGGGFQWQKMRTQRKVKKQRSDTLHLKETQSWKRREENRKKAPHMEKKKQNNSRVCKHKQVCPWSVN